jgi:hypothetical protein
MAIATAREITRTRAESPTVRDQSAVTDATLKSACNPILGIGEAVRVARYSGAWTGCYPCGNEADGLGTRRIRFLIQYFGAPSWQSDDGGAA